MTFPDKKFKDAASYLDSYFEQISEAARSVDEDRLVQAAKILTQVYTDGGASFTHAAMAGRRRSRIILSVTTASSYEQIQI